MAKREKVIEKAHGKLILSGEHIVVYNKPAIAIPFPLIIRAEVSEKPGEISISSKLFTGILSDMPENMKGLSECIHRCFKMCNQPKEGVHIDIISDIPEGRGLGSSAASAMAVIKGIFKFFHQPLSEENLFSLVELSETYAHGKPSGIDMMAVASQGPILYQKQEKKVMPLIPPCAFPVIVADTGQVGDTKKAVEHVNALKIQKPSYFYQTIEQMEEIVIKVKEAVLEGNLTQLGSLLIINHEKLKKLNVSNSVLDYLVEVALKAGALGAKLTGGGMGGCIIALAKDMKDAENIGAELQNKGAKTVWYFKTGSSQVYQIKC